MPEAASSRSADFVRTVQDAIDRKTKPLGALGRLEDLAAQLAEVQQTLTPEAGRCRLTVFAADHGIAEAGAMMGAAEKGKLVLVDVFIAAVSALAARRFMPSIERHLVFAHRSAEPGHSVVLEAMGAEPLLDLQVRLGEGTGALLAWPLVRAAAAKLRDMASFRSAGVSEKS